MIDALLGHVGHAPDSARLNDRHLGSSASKVICFRAALDIIPPNTVTGTRPGTAHLPTLPPPPRVPPPAHSPPDLNMQSTTPANGEPTRPKQKRIRKGAACNECRTKRCRCDGIRPTCGTCVRNNEPECTYNAMELRPRTVILQQRVDDLEAQLRLANEISNKIEIIRTHLPSAADLPMRARSSGASMSPLAPENYLDTAQLLQMQL
ncbi:hypothetical protein BOTBODRAFT_182399, partial [Botryobasidium botryosum FD-172 SS1]